jgi:hypothetical protein
MVNASVGASNAVLVRVCWQQPPVAPGGAEAGRFGDRSVRLRIAARSAGASRSPAGEHERVGERESPCLWRPLASIAAGTGARPD